MSTRQPANMPAALSTARRQLDRWRSQQPHKRARLPGDLWQNAAALARTHGLNKTASALGLKYESLKKHLIATATERAEPRGTPCQFLELLPSPVTSPSIDCTIELEDGDGQTVRMHIKGVRMTDLASFARGFRGGRG
jgi:hypothetical protein